MKNIPSFRDLIKNHEERLDKVLAASQYVGLHSTARITSEIEENVDKITEDIQILKRLEHDGWEIAGYNKQPSLLGDYEYHFLNKRTMEDGKYWIKISREDIEAGGVVDKLLLADISADRDLYHIYDINEYLFAITLSNDWLYIKSKMSDAKCITGLPTSKKEEDLRNKLAEIGQPNSKFLNRLVHTIIRFYRVEQYLADQTAIRSSDSKNYSVTKITPLFMEQLDDAEEIFDLFYRLSKDGWEVYTSLKPALRRAYDYDGLKTGVPNHIRKLHYNMLTHSARWGSWGKGLERTGQNMINFATFATDVNVLNLVKDRSGTIVLGDVEIESGAYFDLIQLNKLVVGTPLCLGIPGINKKRRSKPQPEMVYILDISQKTHYINGDCLYIAPRFMKDGNTEKLQPIKLRDGSIIYSNQAMIDSGIFKEGEVNNVPTAPIVPTGPSQEQERNGKILRDTGGHRDKERSKN